MYLSDELLEFIRHQKETLIREEYMIDEKGRIVAGMRHFGKVKSILTRINNDVGFS